MQLLKPGRILLLPSSLRLALNYVSGALDVPKDVLISPELIPMDCFLPCEPLRPLTHSVLTQCWPQQRRGPCSSMLGILFFQTSFDSWLRNRCSCWRPISGRLRRSAKLRNPCITVVNYWPVEVALCGQILSRRPILPSLRP